MKLIVKDATNEEINEWLKKEYGGHPDPVGEKGEPGVKIPVISMEDVLKLAKEMEK